MKMTTRTGRCLVFVLLLMVSTACANNDNHAGEAESSVKEIGWHRANNQSTADEAKKELIKMEEVTDVKAVQFDKELLVALDVRQRNKFQLKPISKKATKTLEKKFPGKNVTVSTDPKTLLELGKLEDQLTNGNLDKGKLQKQVKKIQELEQDRY
jgi:uncharacterized protein YpuA (DUF1002 family)